MAAAVLQWPRASMFHSRNASMGNFNEKDKEKALELSPYYKQTRLLGEYKSIKHNFPAGVNVMPSISSYFVWEGAIILRDGIYKGSMFKFQINIPQNYPSEPPSIKFSSRVFHPQISPTGEVNLSPLISTFKDPNGYILPILRYLQSIFYNIDPSHPSNPMAAVVYTENKKEFEKEVRVCVKKSLDFALDNEGNNGCFRFSEFAANQDVIRQYALKDERRQSFSRRSNVISNYLDFTDPL